MSTLYVRNGTGHVRKARVAKLSQDDDLALLEIDRPFPEGAIVPFSDIVQPVAGRAAIVMGYPMIGLLGDEQPALTEGIVAKAAGLGNDPNTFQLTSKINKGNSGGPVFDKRGRLLGVAVGKADSVKVFEKTGTVVEDMNIGIKGGRILAFLGKSPSRETEPPEMSLEDLYREMLPRAVLIVGQK
jgi:S1-C subfamily serine protease